MTGENPYAPPTVSEPQSVLICSGDGWKLLGDILIVRKGATLPKVDLETGSTSTSLKPYRFPYSVFFPSPESFFCFAKPNRIPLRWLRGFMWNVSIFALFFAPSLIPKGVHVPYVPSEYLPLWPLVMLALILVVPNMDRPKLKIEDSVTPGWLRVTNLHPLALSYLRDIADKKDLRYYPQSP